MNIFKVFLGNKDQIEVAKKLNEQSKEKIEYVETYKILDKVNMEVIIEESAKKLTDSISNHIGYSYEVNSEEIDSVIQDLFIEALNSPELKGDLVDVVRENIKESFKGYLSSKPILDMRGYK